MSIKLPGIKFDGGAFGHTFVGRRAGRWLQAQFDGIGEPAVIYIVQNNRMLLDYFPAQMKVHYKKLAQEYKEMFPSFTDDEVYLWIPEYWREVIESVDGGKEWGMRQVACIRAFALT